jgi:hypothetical protein
MQKKSQLQDERQTLHFCKVWRSGAGGRISLAAPGGYAELFLAYWQIKKPGYAGPG